MNVSARPFDFPLDRGHAALVIIDMQRDFVEPGGFGETLGNDVSLLQAIVPACQRALAAWRAAGGLVVHTREAHLPDLSDCPVAKRERGNQIIPELAPLPGEWVIDKPGKGAFYATRLHDMLQAHGIRQLVYMGVTTEVCVQTSMREANDRGYDCLLLEDCTESYFPAFKTATVDMVVAQGGIVGWCTPSAALLQALAAET
jgi:biuret amidohydrolase